jgi:hypothetical protein
MLRKASTAIAAALALAACAGAGPGGVPAAPVDAAAMDVPAPDPAARDAGAPEHLHPVPRDAPDGRIPTDGGYDFARATADPALLAIAGELHGAFLEMECVGEEIELQFCIPKDKAIDLPLKFGGETGKRYAVALKVWGVVEGVLYTGGKQLGENFYAGGEGTTPKTASWGLIAGGQTYYLNHFVMGAGEHYTYGITYETPPIPIDGASTLTFFVHSPDEIINTNHMQNVVIDPTVALQDRLAKIESEHVQGQFIYLEVVSAKLMP